MSMTAEEAADQDRREMEKEVDQLLGRIIEATGLDFNSLSLERKRAIVDLAREIADPEF